MEPDDYDIKIGDINTITISSSSVGDIYFNVTDNSLYTVNDNYDWVTIDSISTLKGTLFKDHMPEPAELEKMCEEYPGLEKAYENFKTFYKLVEQDWRGKQKEKRE
jgi:hypothetical protein